MAMEEIKAPMPRRVKLALITSLAVNVLVIGAVAGAMIKGGERPPKGYSDRSGSSVAIGIYGHALEKADRRAVGALMRADRKAQRREIRAELGALAAKASDLLVQTPFDKQAFANVLLEQQHVIKGSADAMQTALVEHIAAMSPERRAAYAQRLNDALEKGARRRKSDRK